MGQAYVPRFYHVQMYFSTVYIHVPKSVFSLTELPHSIWVDDSCHHHCQLHCPGSGTTFTWWGQDAVVWTPGKFKKKKERKEKEKKKRHDTVCKPYVNLIKSRRHFWLGIDFTSVEINEATLLMEAEKCRNDPNILCYNTWEPYTVLYMP